jgi:hypothetical protein
LKLKKGSKYVQHILLTPKFFILQKISQQKNEKRDQNNAKWLSLA